MRDHLLSIIVVWGALSALARRSPKGAFAPAPAEQVSRSAKPTPASIVDRLKTGAFFVSAAVGVLLAALSAREISADAVTIEVFSVPETLQKSGYDGRSLALRFIDKVSEIGTKSQTQLPRRAYAAEWQRDDLNVAVPQLQTNLRAVVAAIRRTLRIPQVTFTCSIAEKAPDAIEVSARVVGYTPFFAVYPRTELDSAIADVAEYYYRTTQPMVFAAYKCSDADDQKRFDCIEVLTRVLRQPPTHESFYALNLMGLVQQPTDKAAALEFFTDAAEFDCPMRSCIENSVRASAFSNRSRVYLQLGDVKKALADLDMAARLAPRNAAILTNLGVALTRAGRFTEAANTLDAAVKLDSGFALAYLERGNLMTATGDRRRALRDFAEAIRRDPASAEPYFKRAELLRSTGDLAAAARDERRARLLRRRTVYDSQPPQAVQSSGVRF